MNGRWFGFLVAAGCGGVRVDGDVDGERPVLRDAYFVEEDEQFDGGDGMIVVVLSGIQDACAVDEALWDEIGEVDDASDLEDLWQELQPEDYWSVEVTLRVGDPDDELSGTSLQGVGWDDGLSEDGRFYAGIWHYTAWLDQEFWSGAADDLEEYYDFWWSDGGDLDIGRHVPGELIRGELVTEPADPGDGDKEGDLAIGFAARRCKGMERYVFGDRFVSSGDDDDDTTGGSDVDSGGGGSPTGPGTTTGTPP